MGEDARLFLAGRIVERELLLAGFVGDAADGFSFGRVNGRALARRRRAMSNIDDASPRLGRRVPDFAARADHHALAVVAEVEAFQRLARVLGARSLANPVAGHADFNAM